MSVGLYTNVFRIVVKAMLLQRDSDNIKRAVMIVSKNYCQHLTIIWYLNECRAVVCAIEHFECIFLVVDFN